MPKKKSDKIVQGVIVRHSSAWWKVVGSVAIDIHATPDMIEFQAVNVDSGAKKRIREPLSTMWETR